MVLEATRLTHCIAPSTHLGRGGGIWALSSNIFARDSFFTDNCGGAWGGGIMAESSNLVLNATKFSVNNASARGGGLCAVDTAVVVMGGSFDKCTSAFGGGLQVSGGGSLVMGTAGGTAPDMSGCYAASVRKGRGGVGGRGCRHGR